MAVERQRSFEFGAPHMRHFTRVNLVVCAVTDRLPLCHYGPKP